ncbi:asparaginase [Pseudohoeflea suaedae]|uniref:Asparaginase n=1 Tax=Pseudohoeflea suaedae TaxID=877384 RepID=A0A4R5PQ45_9HYPH|nr:asparaginase [Pseudohoeflea suaedae]TDH38801.1 asparaginase [Pseudohoeflea suaedae]
MQNPVLVEVTRGDRVESAHRGMVAVVDGDGNLVMGLGEIELPVYPRSAVKSMQALPLVENGAAAAYGFGNRELAMSCASHSGEPEHVAAAGDMVARAGLSEVDFECGSHWSFYPKVMIEQVRDHNKPDQLFNNCSGKHAGFLCVSCHAGVDHHGYTGYDHFVQEGIRDVMEDLTGAPLGTDVCGYDGCSIPTYAVPLKSIAHGFARMATGVRLGAERAKAAKMLMSACMAEPFYVAGTGRACTELMELAPGRIFVKVGAEGVYCGAIPELGLGIALKCEDGAERAANVMIAAVLAKLLTDDAELSAKLAEMARPKLSNWNKMMVGGLQPAGELA